MFGGSEAGMNESAGFVSEMHRLSDPSPSCHRCGCVMTALGGCRALQLPHELMGAEYRTSKCIDWKVTLWRCRSCGATTQPS